MLHDIFKWVITASCMGTALTLLTILARPLTRKLFSAEWHYYIWLAALAVMIVPVKFNLPTDRVDVIPVQMRTVAVAGQKFISPVTEITVYQIGLEEVWLAGAIILLLVKLLSYAVFRHRLRKTGEEISCSIISDFTDKKITVMRSGMTISPLMTGLFNPTLVLPETPMTEDQLEFVLAHEMMHLKRKDILYKWIVCFVKCVHWFNPVIYFAARQIDIECEISCDIGATESMKREEKKAYVDTVLTLISARSKRLPFTTGMAGSKKTMKKRILSIAKERQRGKIIKILSVTALAICLVGTMFVSGAAAGIMLEEIEAKLELKEKLPVLEKLFGGWEIEKATENPALSLPVENMETVPDSKLEMMGEKETAQEEENDLAEELSSAVFEKPENAKVVKYNSDENATHYITLTPNEKGCISV